MIATLNGTVEDKSFERGVVVSVGGVGYLVHVSMQTLAELPAAGEPVHLLCHTHVREDALQIYGFLHETERQAFELLILVSGIGPRLALTMLSGMPVLELLGAVAGGDARRLQSIPGVGKRTAERVIVELKDRCAKLKLEPEPRVGAVAASGAGEVVDALVNLGYKRAVAEKAIDRALQEQEGAQSAEQLLRRALAAIAEL
jgi:Holliday junction DNA helicase RuvA